METNEEKLHGPRCHHALSGSEKLMMLFRHCFLAIGRCHHQEGGASFPGQKRVLGILSHRDNISQRSLIEESGLRPASLGELLQKIEKSGFIVREPDADDKRSMIVSLTDRGKEAVAEAKQERQAQADRLFSVLSEEEQQSLTVLLQKLADAWHTEDDDAPTCGRPHHHGHGHEPGHGCHHGHGEGEHPGHCHHEGHCHGHRHAEKE